MNFKDFTGKRFGPLLIVDRQGTNNNGSASWNAKCNDCGETTIIGSQALLRTKQIRCSNCSGAHKALIGENLTAYQSWRAMIQRCTDKNSKDYSSYGALGISVCAQWLLSFAAFLAYLGPRPIGTSIDRYPNQAGNYEPGNTRWATAAEQARNRKNSKLTFSVAQEILGRFEHGETRKSISDRMCLSRTHVTSVINGSRWRELDRPWLRTF